MIYIEAAVRANIYYFFELNVIYKCKHCGPHVIVVYEPRM